MSDITMTQARAAVDAARSKSEEIDTKMNIAVVDAGGNLKAFARMDDAWLGSIDIAINKARTARYFDMDTGEIGKLSQPGGPLYNIEHSNGGLISFPAGSPSETETPSSEQSVSREAPSKTTTRSPKPAPPSSPDASAPSTTQYPKAHSWLGGERSPSLLLSSVLRVRCRPCMTPGRSQTTLSRRESGPRFG